ncbi:MAG: hypothetical protein DI562_04610 [Stenotrophomonas acidaminiphila]|nr:MAG: hypothetical protein DI562_04610 [Stenotrophomonas acidaminiphila]
MQGVAAGIACGGAGLEVLFVGDLTGVVFQHESRQSLGVVSAGGDIPLRRYAAGTHRAATHQDLRARGYPCKPLGPTPELQAMLSRARIRADDEFPIPSALGKGRPQLRGGLLGLCLVNSGIAVRPPVLCAGKDSSGVGPRLTGKELIDRRPPASCSGFIGNGAGIVPAPSQAKTAVPIDVPIRAERRKRGMSREFAHRYLLSGEAQGKVEGVLRAARAFNRHDGLSTLGDSMKRDAIISRHALQQTVGINH